MGLYEHRSAPLLPTAGFLRRMGWHTLAAVGVIAIALLIGMVGYHGFAGLPWIDAFLNASMLLGGMGPVDILRTNSAKLFAGFYALFSGLVFIGVTTLLIAPIVHRILHRVHLEDAESEECAEG